jgi:glycosyltransferase involved in cell wall biosynthesis
MRQVATAEVCVGMRKPEQFSVLLPSTAGFERALPVQSAICCCPSRSQAILASKPRASGECRSKRADIDPGVGMRVLFIATRVPYGQMYGHKMGMRTYIKALKALGHQVISAAFSVPGEIFDSEDLDVKTYYLPMPSSWTIFINIMRSWFLKGKCINECLYYEKSTLQRVRQICQTHAIEFIIADMIRTAPYAEAMGIPWSLNHDDLLSSRYRRWTTQTSRNDNILGYLTGCVPSYMRPSIRLIFRMMLKREAQLLTRREVYWTDKAQCSSLRSLTETASLAARAEGRVFCMPPAVAVPEASADRLSDRPISAVFTGGLTYQPNLDALRAYVEKVLPAFAKLGVEPPQLSVIGICPEALMAGLAHRSIRFLGYVSDINEELRKHRVFLAPIVSGSGIKTKVLEAMACGLPVIALPDAVSGILAENRRHCLVATGPEEFVQFYSLVINDPAFAECIGRAGRELVMRSYSIEAATEVLGNELATALSTKTPCRRQRHNKVDRRHS